MKSRSVAFSTSLTRLPVAVAGQRQRPGDPVPRGLEVHALLAGLHHATSIAGCVAMLKWSVRPADRRSRFGTLQDVDPHAVLGLPPDASPDEVHRAYRDLAKRFHPDRVGAKEGEMMISINAAYDLLRDRLEEGHGRDARAAHRPRAPRAAPTTTARSSPAPGSRPPSAASWPASCSRPWSPASRSRT